MACRLYSATYTATDCSQSQLQTLINSASDGDTILLPAATGYWSGTMTLNKGLTIRGAGIDKTMILDSSGQSVDPFVVNSVEGKPYRICHMTFVGNDFTGGATNSRRYVLYLTGTCKNFRVDHCKFLNLRTAIYIDGDTHGLIDNCFIWALQYNAYDGVTGGTSINGIAYNGADDAAYTRPLSLGTSNALYIEGCDFHFSSNTTNLNNGNVPSVAPSHGSRVVIRHNTIQNSQFEIYRPGNPAGTRGSLSAEIYNNVFSTDNTNNYRPQGIIFIGGGTGVIFNNTITGTSYNHAYFAANNERSCSTFAVFGKCDGSSSYDGNQISSGQPGAGYPCMDQPGRGADPDNDGVQEPAPWYEWNNTLNGSDIDIQIRRSQCSDLNNHLVSARDFYVDTQMPGYMPYVYPHPMQSCSYWGDCVADTSSPTAPAVVRDGATTGSDVDSSTSLTQLSANWAPSADGESGIARYWYAIGSAPGVSDTAAWTDNGIVTSVTRTGLTLAEGVTYYFTVKAINGAGLESPAANSNGQYVTTAGTVPVIIPVPVPPVINSSIHAYPNPCDLTQHNGMEFRMKGMAGGEVSIYTVSGRLIRKLAGSGTGISWDGRNETGEKAGRGIYIYKIASSNGDTASGKIVLTK